jgi:hypothetical protein
MAEQRQQPKHEFKGSLNIRERKEYVEKVNNTNKVMLQRLEAIKPIVSKDKMLEDYERHKKIASQLRKQRFGVVDAKRSPPRHIPPIDGSKSQASFDAQSYMTRFMMDGSITSENPISSISEFRKQVISSKRLGSSTSHGNSSDSFNGHGQASHNGSMQGTSNISNQESSVRKNDIRFELSHNPGEAPQSA